MSRVLVDGAGYTEACDALYDGNHAIHDALSRLSGALDGSAGMAGGDQSGEQWARDYDGAAGQLTDAGSQLCDVFAKAANLMNTSLANHDAADGASIYGGYPGEPIARSWGRNPDHRAEGIYFTVPSAYGSPGGGEPGWWHWIASHMEGWFWPNADTATLRRVGSAWQSSGVAIQCAGAFASSAADCLGIERSPEIAVATDALGDLGRHCSDIGAAFVDLGKACEDYAQMVEDKHHEIEDEIGSFAKWTAGTEVAGGLISLVTGGLAEVPTQFIEGAEVANAARRVIESLKALLEAVKGSELVAAITTRIEKVTTSLARFLRAGKDVPELEEAAVEVDEELGKIIKGATSYATKQEARAGLEGDARVAANRFFRDATGKCRDFKITEMENGSYRLEYFAPARNEGWGKLYVQYIDRDGNIIKEFKDTLHNGKLHERKWWHGGP